MKIILKSHNSSQVFWKVTKGLYICDLYSKFFRVFQNIHCPILSQENLWPNTCKIIKDSYKFFNLYHSSLKERETFFCTSKQTIVNQETVSLLICKVLWTQGKGIPGWFRSCKGIYKVSENLKWVTWGLNIGTGRGRTSITLTLQFSLS